MTAQSLPRQGPPGIAIATDAAAREAYVASHSGPCAVPLGIAHPKGEAQIEALVHWANANGVPLVAVSSSGGPRRRSDTAITRPALVVDVSGMTEVLHADGRNAIAIIEPGVTFPAFDEYLRPFGLRSFKPLLPRRNKSVLTTYLEREPMIAPQDHWDTSDPLSALSFTFGNGAPFRTGGASIPGSLATNLKRGNRQMMSSGPSATDYTRVLLGAQGTLGIVHWASIYCERIPEQEEAYFYGSNSLHDVASFVRLLALRQLWAHCFVVDRAQAAAALGLPLGTFDSPAAGGAALPRWLIYVSIAASEARADAAMAWKRASLASLGGQAGVQLIEAHAGCRAMDLARRIQNLPEQPYKDAPRGAHREVFCLSQLNRVDALVAAVEPFIAEASVRTGGEIEAGIYIQPTVQGASCHLDVTLFHTPRCADAAAELDRRIIERLADAGGFISRPYGAWSEIAFRHAPGIVPYLNKAKAMFDPNNLLNPTRLCF